MFISIILTYSGVEIKNYQTNHNPSSILTNATNYGAATNSRVPYNNEVRWINCRQAARGLKTAPEIVDNPSISPTVTEALPESLWSTSDSAVQPIRSLSEVPAIMELNATMRVGDLALVRHTGSLSLGSLYARNWRAPLPKLGRTRSRIWGSIDAWTWWSSLGDFHHSIACFGRSGIDCDIHDVWTYALSGSTYKKKPQPSCENIISAVIPPSPNRAAKDRNGSSIC